MSVVNAKAVVKAMVGEDFVLRLARAGESDLLRAVVDAAYRHYISRMGQPPGPMLDDYAARIAARQAWVLDRDGIVGVLVLEEAGDGLLLDNIALLPEFQGRGLSARMMAFAEAEAARRGYQEIRLYTHVTMVENIARYLRLGYVETARRSEDGFARVFMTKPLLPGLGSLGMGAA